MPYLTYFNLFYGPHHFRSEKTFQTIYGLINIRPVLVIKNINFIFAAELAFKTVKLPFG
jgi:hypothetical protein